MCYLRQYFGTFISVPPLLFKVLSRLDSVCVEKWRIDHFMKNHIVCHHPWRSVEKSRGFSFSGFLSRWYISITVMNMMKRDVNFIQPTKSHHDSQILCLCRNNSNDSSCLFCVSYSFHELQIMSCILYSHLGGGHFYFHLFKVIYLTQIWSNGMPYSIPIYIDSNIICWSTVMITNVIMISGLINE